MHSYCDALLHPSGGRHVQSGRPGKFFSALHGGLHELRAPGGHLRRVDRLVQLLDRRVRSDHQLLADAFVVEVRDGAERAIDGLGRLDAPGVRDALLDAEALPRGEVVVAPGQILEAHPRHAEANALVPALDRRVVPREPTAAAERRLSLVVDGVLGVGHHVVLARLAQLGIENVVLMPHVEDGRRRRHLLLCQLRNRGLVAGAGAGHADGRDPLVVGGLIAAVRRRDRIDRPRLRAADRQGGAKEAQHLGSLFTTSTQLPNAGVARCGVITPPPFRVRRSAAAAPQARWCFAR